MKGWVQSILAYNVILLLNLPYRRHPSAIPTTARVKMYNIINVPFLASLTLGAHHHLTNQRGPACLSSAWRETVIICRDLKRDLHLRVWMKLFSLPSPSPLFEILRIRFGKFMVSANMHFLPLCAIAIRRVFTIASVKSDQCGNNASSTHIAACRKDWSGLPQHDHLEWRLSHTFNLPPPSEAWSILGRVYAISLDLNRWHRKLRHPKF